METLIDEILLKVGKPLPMIDKVEEVLPGHRIVAVKCVSVNEVYFVSADAKDKFLPSNFLLEVLTQASKAIVLTHESCEKNDVFLSAVEYARFHMDAVPGDKIIVNAEIYQIRSTKALTRASAYIDGKIVAEAHLKFNIISPVVNDEEGEIIGKRAIKPTEDVHDGQLGETGEQDA